MPFESYIGALCSASLLWHAQKQQQSESHGIDKLQVMQVATPIHDRIMRAKISHYNGYEVTTEGDAFILAFHDPADAVSWCM